MDERACPRTPREPAPSRSRSYSSVAASSAARTRCGSSARPASFGARPLPKFTVAVMAVAVDVPIQLLRSGRQLHELLLKSAAPPASRTTPSSPPSLSPETILACSCVLRHRPWRGQRRSRASVHGKGGGGAGLVRGTSLSTCSIVCQRSWLITGRGIAKKIRYAAPSANRQIRELIAEARRECPNCSYVIDNSDVAMQWPGLPAGVKFDPSELELLQHLEQKVGLGGSRPHVLIDEFIPTIDNDEGICYSHPENLPGIKTDGSNAHFFHRVSNAYGCGLRKRRRIINCNNHTVPDEHVRWHKTGRSKAICDNGVIKGWRKIMVLYKASQRGGKPDRANWVMHQYHLGEEEDEKDGELVVSKVFCQLPNKSMEICETETAYEEPDAPASVIGPKTPKTNAPQPRHPKNSPCETEQNIPILQDQLLLDSKGEPTMPIISLEDDATNPVWCAIAEEQQVVGEASRAQLNSDEPLLCHEDPNSLNDKALLPLDYPILSQCRNEMLDWNLNGHGLPDLHNVDLGTPPDFQLADFQFGSQESLGSWLDRI